MFSLEPILFCGKRNLHPDIQEYREATAETIWKDHFMDPTNPCLHARLLMTEFIEVVITMKASVDAHVRGGLYIKKLGHAG